MAKRRRGLEIDQDIQKVFRYGKFYAEVKSRLQIRFGSLSEDPEDQIRDDETKRLESTSEDVIEVQVDEESPKVKVSR